MGHIIILNKSKLTRSPNHILVVLRIVNTENCFEKVRLEESTFSYMQYKILESS